MGREPSPLLPFRAETAISYRRRNARRIGDGRGYNVPLRDCVAQSVEQRPFKPRVLGSSPSAITRLKAAASSAEALVSLRQAS